MRGVDRPISRLPAARALFAGAAILASTSLRPALAQSDGFGVMPDETALAMPRLSHGLGAGLPEPLSPSDAVRIRNIFALQARGAFADAARETAALTDTTLLGHILADRYRRQEMLARPLRASTTQLGDWLVHYADQPDAPAIYAIFVSHLPHGAKAPAPPNVPMLQGVEAAAPAPEEADPADRAFSRNPLLDRTIAERVHDDHIDSALHLLDKTQGLKPLYSAQLRAEVALGALSLGHDERALAIADDAQRLAHGRIGLAGFVGGLARWKLGHYDDARQSFQEAARADLAPASLHAAASFWAGRVSDQLGDDLSRHRWLWRAAAQRLTFYGLLARRTLGFGAKFDGQHETLGLADTEAVGATAPGRRAFALMQVDELDRAEQELRRLWPSTEHDAALGRSIMLVASAAGMTDFAAQLANILQSADGPSYDELRFPLPPWQPSGGFKVSPSLVYGLARLESNFDSDAISSEGARGLMQIRPLTAGFIMGDPNRFAGHAQRLHDPSLNLELGQRYVLYLSGLDCVRGDLIRLLASYNDGPNAVCRWPSTAHAGDDPLLFIETIPNRETRNFVRRALTYHWVYGARLHQPTPSLDTLAEGRWPRLEPDLIGVRHDALLRLH